MTRTFVPLLALVLAVPCLSQGKIYVVDASNGAGTNFLTIRAALTKAVDGDRILVRKGTYTGFVVTRGVAIIGSPGVLIAGSQSFVEVRGLPAGRVASISGMSLQVPLVARDCAGRVLFEGVTVGNIVAEIWRCKHLSVTRCSLPFVFSYASTVVISKGATFIDLTLYASDVTLVNTPMSGPPGRWWYGKWFPASSVITVDKASKLTITGDGSALIQGASTTYPVIGGNGSLVLDPRVRLKNYSGGVLIDPRIKVTKRTVPFLDAQGSWLGGTVRVTLKAGANHPFFLAIGLPGNVTPVPSLGGSIWLDLNTAILITTGKLDASGAYGWHTAVPRDNALLGLVLVWQGTAGPSLSQQYLSNPSIYVHGL